jgi:hypothetical protein
MSPELTADAVATYGDNLVLVERNKEPEGLALPGGHQEPGETLKATAIREMKERPASPSSLNTGSGFTMNREEIPEDRRYQLFTLVRPMESQKALKKLLMSH